ncbi:unnamed protein product [Brugia timori]|nr:unnamed protein product [Brugia timori]
MMIVILWAILAVAMFLLRPNSMRSRPDSLGKPGPRPGGDAPEPPAPNVH